MVSCGSLFGAWETSVAQAAQAPPPRLTSRSNPLAISKALENPRIAAARILPSTDRLSEPYRRRASGQALPFPTWPFDHCRSVSAELLQAQSHASGCARVQPPWGRDDLRRQPLG